MICNKNINYIYDIQILKGFTHMISRLLFMLATGSESWSSKRLSKVLSELGDFLIVIPILAFLTPSGGLDFLH